jgi:hypothetical protein
MRQRRDQRPPAKSTYVRKPSTRDAYIILAVHTYRILRQDQLYRLFFASPNTGLSPLTVLVE